MIARIRSDFIMKSAASPPCPATPTARTCRFPIQTAAVGRVPFAHADSRAGSATGCGVFLNGWCRWGGLGPRTAAEGYWGWAAVCPGCGALATVAFDHVYASGSASSAAWMRSISALAVWRRAWMPDTTLAEHRANGRRPCPPSANATAPAQLVDWGEVVTGSRSGSVANRVTPSAKSTRAR